MTDKELIKQEIERIEQILDDFNKTHNNTIDNGIVSAKKNICKHIKSFIDLLPEEPKCIYNRTLDERKKFCKYCSAACDVRIEEESASKDWKNTILNTNDIKIMYASRKAGIESFAETYSFNIESVLFNQLTSEQQKLWRKEIENAIISGGEMGLELADDKRYDEIESSEDLEEEINRVDDWYPVEIQYIREIAHHFAEWQKQQIIKDAVDVIFLQDYAYKTPILYGNLKDKMNIVSGQTIKLYQIKKEQQ